jgi:hypothetical protein
MRLKGNKYRNVPKPDPAEKAESYRKFLIWWDATGKDMDRWPDSWRNRFREVEGDEPSKVNTEPGDNPL